jgi:DNA-binding NarL/FixJ family response regulator
VIFAPTSSERTEQVRIAPSDPTNVRLADDWISADRLQHLLLSLALTPRQSQLARLICQGHTYKSMALSMGISVNTVRVHVRALFAKLGMHDRLGVVLHILALDRAVPQELQVSHAH